MKFISDEFGQIPVVVYVTVYAPGVEAERSTIPVPASMLNPAGAEEKAPPAAPVMVGVGFVSVLQYDALA